MSTENSCLVDYRLTAIKPGEYLYSDTEFFWAEPSTEHAAFFMRRLVADQRFSLTHSKARPTGDTAVDEPGSCRPFYPAATGSAGRTNLILEQIPCPPF